MHTKKDFAVNICKAVISQTITYTYKELCTEKNPKINSLNLTLSSRFDARDSAHCYVLSNEDMKRLSILGMVNMEKLNYTLCKKLHRDTKTTKR
jgi:hypothetical protein